MHAEEISGNNGYVELSFCAKKLDDKVRGAHIFWWRYQHSSCFIRFASVALDRDSSRCNMIVMILYYCKASGSTHSSSPWSYAYVRNNFQFQKKSLYNFYVTRWEIVQTCKNTMIICDYGSHMAEYTVISCWSQRVLLWGLDIADLSYSPAPTLSNFAEGMFPSKIQQELSSS